MHKILKQKTISIPLFTLFSLLSFLFLGSLLTPYSHRELFWDHICHSPSWELKFYFGTDSLGRDLFSRLLVGGRISLSLALLASLLCVSCGTILGLLSGYFSRWIDRVIMGIADFLYGFPFLLSISFLFTLFERNPLFIFLSIALLEWPDIARMIRAHTLSMKNQPFIQYARCSGASTYTIFLKEILPNLSGPLFIYTSLIFQRALMIESFLSFLGLGIQEPMTSLGLLIGEGVQQIETEWWSFFFPTTFLLFSVLSLIYLGEELRKTFSVKEQIFKSS